MAGSTSIVDEEGNLFGVVNVIDALVVLFVLAVVVAGASLVLGGGETESDPTPTLDTTYVTLDLGSQPDYILSAINEGDAYSPDSSSTLTITDVHVAPVGEQMHAVARAELRGPVDGDGVTYAGTQPRLGRQLGISTDRYNTSGAILAVGDSDTLQRGNRTVVLRDTLSTSEAREVAAGDEIRVDGRPVATVEDVAVYPTGNASQQTVFVEAELNTYTRRGTHYFGTSRVRSGQRVTLPGEAYSIDGEITRVGGGLERGSVDILVEETVSAETAERISVGDTATVAGYDTAEVETASVFS